MMHITAIKIIVDNISHLLKLLSSQVMEAIPIKGTINPPGALNVFSAVPGDFILSLMVAKITAR
jgi:hypothetical protein